jgi:hypothetical protein
MPRRPLILGAGVAVITAAAVFATAGCGQSPKPTSLHLVLKAQATVGFGGSQNPRQGDRFGFGDTVTGDDTGVSRGMCTLIGTNQLCTAVFQLSKGTLTGEGLFGASSKTPVAITGGTGAYRDARETALQTETGPTSEDIQITLPH